MVQILFVFTRTTPLNRSEWGACIVTGTTVIPIAAMLKMTGPGLLKKIPFTKFIDEDKEVEDGVVDNITKYTAVQVNIKADALTSKKKGPQANEYDDG